MTSPGRDAPARTAMEPADHAHELARDDPPADRRGDLGRIDAADEWLAIPWPTEDGDEQRKLVRELVLRALI